MTIKTIEGNHSASEARIAIVAGRWHELVVEGLLEGALRCLRENGLQEGNLVVVRAPGAFEIPLVVKRLAESKRYDAIITLGAVIRGDTPHFEYVAGSCVEGMAAISLEYNVPVAFGVLTVNTYEQALERIGGKPEIGHKGVEAALSALEMINLLKQL